MDALTKPLNESSLILFFLSDPIIHEHIHEQFILLGFGLFIKQANKPKTKVYVWFVYKQKKHTQVFY